MVNVLVVGEKTSQVKKFIETVCSTYSSQKQSKYIYTYSGSATLNKIQYNFTFLPLAGHISTLETSKGYNWGECPPIKLVYDERAIEIKYNRKYVKLLSSQIKNKEELWLALDPDSEGDNIALEVVDILKSRIKSKKIAIRRIWNSSLTTSEINRSFMNPREWHDKLALGVQGRRLIDAWLGFAGTRELTRATRQIAKVKVISVGRVQLPTLYAVVRQDVLHETFIPVQRWKLIGNFKCKNSEEYKGEHISGFFSDIKEVERLKSKLVNSRTAIVTEIKHQSLSKKPLLPLNTTAAISHLSRIMKISADKGLNLLVDLYNKGLLSYPRTENKKFKKNFPHQDILSKLLAIKEYISFISSIKDMKKVRNNGPIKGEEEDHDPIHPTGETGAISSLTNPQHQAFDIMCRYYISLFMDDFIVNKTKIITKVDTENFVTEGRLTKQLGWREPQFWLTTKENTVPALSENEIVDILNLNITMSRTKPPEQLSDSSLLLEMERANIGTKSSRPEIIKKIIQRNYIFRKNRKLISTSWGRALIASLIPIWPEVVTPKFTDHVESLMQLVGKGEETYDYMITQLRTEYISLHKDLIDKIPEYKNLLKNLNLSDQHSYSPNTDDINKILQPLLLS